MTHTDECCQCPAFSCSSLLDFFFSRNFDPVPQLYPRQFWNTANDSLLNSVDTGSQVGGVNTLYSPVAVRYYRCRSANAGAHTRLILMHWEHPVDNSSYQVLDICDVYEASVIKMLKLKRIYFFSPHPDTLFKGKHCASLHPRCIDLKARVTLKWMSIRKSSLRHS